MTVVEDRTRALVAPPSTSVDGDARTALRRQLVTRLSPLVAPLPAAVPLTVSLPLLRLTRATPEALGAPEEPFAWRPAFVRRSLGLAVVEACAGGRFRTPLDAVGPVAAEAVDRWAQTGWRTFHWEPWMAGLAPGSRAVALAEAVSWASSLWSSLDWTELGPRAQFGGEDDQWACPSTHTVRLRARSELRVPLDQRESGAVAAGNRGRVVLVSVSGGCPSEAWPAELAYLALVASLRSPSRPVPARVTGIWPDSGEARSIEIDEPALAAAVDLVVDGVAAVVDARWPVPA